MVYPFDCPKLQGTSRNKVVVFGIDANKLGVMRVSLLGHVGDIPVVNYNVDWVFCWSMLGALLVGMYEVEAIVWEVEEKLWVALLFGGKNQRAIFIGPRPDSDELPASTGYLVL